MPLPALGPHMARLGRPGGHRPPLRAWAPPALRPDRPSLHRCRRALAPGPLPSGHAEPEGPHRPCSCAKVCSPHQPRQGQTGPSTGRQELGLLLSPLALSCPWRPSGAPLPHTELSALKTSAGDAGAQPFTCLCGTRLLGPSRGVVTRPSTPACTAALPQAHSSPCRGTGACCPWDCLEAGHLGRQRHSGDPPQPHWTVRQPVPLQVPRGGGGREGPKELQPVPPAPAHVQWGHLSRQVLVRAGAGGGLSKSCL